MSQVTEVEIDRLFVGKCNVRKEAGDLSELIASVRQVGILVPLIVRPTRTNKYEIIVGNRRYRVAEAIGLKKIPCIIKEMSDDEAIIASLTENIQRGDLAEEEIAETFLSLHELNPKGWTQEAFARHVGKSQQWVSTLVTAYQSLVKLRPTGIIKSMKAYPRDEERKEGVAPIKHLAEIESALKSEEVRKILPEKELDAKRVELSKTVIELPQEDARRVIDRFKMYPEKPVEEIKDEALARQTGVALETYLPPRLARELDRVAEERKVSMEEVLPEVVEAGLRAGRETKERGEVPAKMVDEVDVGEVECPKCGAVLRLIHCEPGRTHKVERTPS